MFSNFTLYDITILLKIQSPQKACT